MGNKKSEKTIKYFDIEDVVHYMKNNLPVEGEVVGISTHTGTIIDSSYKTTKIPEGKVLTVLHIKDCYDSVDTDKAFPRQKALMASLFGEDIEKEKTTDDNNEETDIPKR